MLKYGITVQLEVDALSEQDAIEQVTLATGHFDSADIVDGPHELIPDPEEEEDDD